MRHRLAYNRPIGRRAAPRLRVLLTAAAACLLTLAAALDLTAQEVATDVAPADLEPGQFVWDPAASPSGPVVVLVSIAEQRLYAYRNGILIAYSTVSTGKPGHETPTGVFTVLQKDADHVSNLFKGAKMPNMQRLTWTGIALHAGNLPGYPASHGCVRLPIEFSRLLFELDPMGTTVVIADEHAGPAEAAHPGMLLSPDLEAATEPAAMQAETYEWRPERAVEGAVSVLLSSADRKIYVYRNGVEIGSSAITLLGPEAPLHEGVFTVLEGLGDRESPFVPGRPDHRWMSVALHGSQLPAGDEEAELRARVRIPAAFAEEVYGLLGPGTTLVVTNREAAPHLSSDQEFVIAATHHPEEG